MYKIPFNKPCFEGHEQEYIADAIANRHISGNGPFTQQCEELLQKALGVPRVLLTTSCTHALEMAALLLNIQPGDEVIVPSFTFVSTVNAFILQGARPVFIDIRPDTLNMNERLLEQLITPRTKAVLPVHYGGVACEMDAILTLSEKHGIQVVEDNAHGLFGTYREQQLGTFGCLATQSFHETKNFTCGEGGALVINDEQMIERAEIIREKGTDRNRFFRGEVDKYTWVDVGSSFIPSDILAAFLLAQLEAREQIQSCRQRIWNTYAEELADWAGERGVTMPSVPEHCSHPCHLFYLLMPSAEAREGLIAHLKDKSILSVFHYLPLHRSTMGQKYGATECPVTDDVSDRLVRLPFYNHMTEDEQAYVIEQIKTYT
jgi:dTDP-4-amino-4,6-dideoxygalactose transaminase